MVQLRTEVATEHCWDLSSMFNDFDIWERSYNKLIKQDEMPYWPELEEFQGRLEEGPKTVKQMLELKFGIERELTKLYTWAHLKHDEDIASEKGKDAFGRISLALNSYTHETAWIEPELLSLPQQTLQDYVNSQELAPYKFFLEKLLRLKAHTLSSEGEKIMALAGQPLMTSYKSFNALSDADMVFGEVENGEGQLLELTHGSYGIFIRSYDRTLRKNAFEMLHEKYHGFQNTLAELYNGCVQNHVFDARARSYQSCLESALYPKNIPTQVYRTLIKTVNDNLTVLHRYISLRKKVLNLPQFHLYDAYVPLVPNVDMKISYEEAEEKVIHATKLLGGTYQDILQKGLTEDRWVDRYENKNKRSGAYSSGCYDSHPYILMNFKGTMRDLFTLSHEAGHSMHSYLSRRNQPFQYADYPIFLAEVASTLNEELLFRHLLENTTDQTQRIFLLNQKIEDIRATFFRQTMFAEFELVTHEMGERNEPLTPEKLNQLYLNLNKKYFSTEAVLDSYAESEWSRIPHFYYNFYVFQYATGISAALSLAEEIRKNGKPATDKYLKLLSSGGSQYPIELLKEAGVDMCSAKPFENTIKIFSDLLKELELALG